MKSFHHSEFGDVGELGEMKRELGVRISVCVPTLNEEDTIGGVVGVLRRGLMEEVNFIDELVVMDSGSGDRTVEVARACGAEVYLADDILPGVGRARGKGENIWKAVAVMRGEILCFLDGDVRNMHPRFVLGVVGPLLADPRLKYVKGMYDRPHAAVEVGVRPAGGGRVTEALVRPLFSLFFPALAELVQPLAGEYAGRREVLEAIPMPTGYGVETAHLMDVAARWGEKVIAQTDLDERLHRHQDTTSLGRMGFAILHAFLPRAGMAETGTLNRVYRHFMRQDGVLAAMDWELPDMERPPLLSVPEYRRMRGL
jgi:glucosyl-3-phosphoglycerate synthase